MKSNPYFTHQKYLMAELNKLDNFRPSRILEFGTGNGSAFIFSDYTSRYRNLQVQAYEDNFDWYNNMKRIYQSKTYIFHHVDWKQVLESRMFEDYVYDIVFVDVDPQELRIKLIHYIKDCSKIIILHDYDFHNKGVIDDIFSVGEGSFFKKEFGDEFTMEGHHEMLPPTLILKNNNYE